MPSPNLVVGLYGIFVPAIDPSLVTIPAEDPVNVSQGVYSKPVATQFLFNLSRFLQQIASSSNASLGGQLSANMMTGFDIVFSAAATINFTAGMFETQYVRGTPLVKTAGNTRQFILTPLPPLPTGATPAGQTQIISYSLGDYWLIGQNNPDTTTYLEVDVSAAIELYGVQIYFGNR